MSGLNKRSIPAACWLCLALLFLAGTAGAAREASLPQDPVNPSVEPFYLRLLKTGEASYASANYPEAIQNLRVAVFGLYGDKTLLSRGQAYLGLSLVKSGDKEAGREFIEKALAAAGGPEKYESLGLALTAQNDLIALMRTWKTPVAPAAEKPPVTAPPAAPVTKPVQKTGADGTAAASSNRIRGLEEAVRLDPRNAAAYFELANLQLNTGNGAAAKTTLKNMLKANPTEVEGHLALGRIGYGEKGYKEADTYLEKFLDLSRATGLGRDKVPEAQALRLLAAQLRNDTKKLRKLLPEYRASLGEETIDALSLSPEDKVRLRGILQNGK